MVFRCGGWYRGEERRIARFLRGMWKRFPKNVMGKVLNCLDWNARKHVIYGGEGHDRFENPVKIPILAGL